MGLFDLFSDALSDAKESAEKSRKAREYIRDAKELVEQADAIYEKAYDKVSSYASETEYRLRKHAEYKNKIAKELGSDIGKTMKEFKNFNIDTKVFDAPQISANISGVDIFKSAAASCVPRIDMPSILDMFISDDDYYEAKHQRDEARRYKERMKMAREEMNSYKEKMSEIRYFMEDEKKELDSLMDKLRKMTGELKGSMQRNTFTSEEAAYLKGIHKISECIINLLSTEFLKNGFAIDQRYQKAFNAIKDINNNLPFAPSISDVRTKNVLKELIEGTIVY